MFWSRKIYFLNAGQTETVSMHIPCTSAQLTALACENQNHSLRKETQTQRDHEKWSSLWDTSPGNLLGNTGKLWKNQKQGKYWGERKFWNKLPLILPTYVQKPHSCSITGCWVCLGFGFFGFCFLNRWSVGYIHKNTVTESYKNKNEAFIFKLFCLNCQIVVIICNCILYVVFYKKDTSCKMW